MGAGWTHSYNVRLVRDSCGNRTVIGGEGSGSTFGGSGATNGDKAQLFSLDPEAKFFTPQIGYHSMLVQPDPENRPFEFDFYSKSHVLYHFELEPSLDPSDTTDTYTLRFIEEPNGNRVSLYYDQNQSPGRGQRPVTDLVPELQAAVDFDPTTLDAIVDASGRALLFEYERIFLEQRLVGVSGYNPPDRRADPDHTLDLLGLHIEYEYDEWGNLMEVTRRDGGASDSDTRIETYDYSTGNRFDRHNLEAYTDPNGNRTDYEYDDGNDQQLKLEPDFSPGYNPSREVRDSFGVPRYEFVREVRDPAPGTSDHGTPVTQFTYNVSSQACNPLSTAPCDANTRTVTDPRGQATTYTLNNYGAAIQTVAALGKTTTTEWCTPESANPNNCRLGVDVLMTAQTDALGRRSEYRYDEFGNLIEEKILLSNINDPDIREVVGATEGFVMTTYTYDPLFSKMTSQTDALGNTTFFCLDSPVAPLSGSPCPSLPGGTGNLRQVVDAIGNTTSYTYDGVGQIRTLTDARGVVTTYEDYDRYGTPPTG